MWHRIGFILIILSFFILQEFRSEYSESKDLDEIEVKIEEHETDDPLSYDFEGPDEGNFEVDDIKGY